MKKLYIITFLFHAFSFCYSQISEKDMKIVDKEVERDLRKYGPTYVSYKTYYPNKFEPSKYASGVNYDSLRDLTDVYFYKKEKEYTVPGKWEHLDRKEYYEYVLISHCPMLSNEDGIILEFAIWEKGENEEYFKNSYKKLKSLKEKFESYNINKAEKYKLVKYDKELNYCLYKKKKLNIYTNEIEDVYYLLGVKVMKQFRITISNFKEEYYSNLEEFIIQCYTMNR